VGEPTGRTVITVRGRVLETPVSRSPDAARLEDSVAWWSALGTLGALLALLGYPVVEGWGSPVAVLGVLLFFATAVVAGAERYEFATALAIAGVVWTSFGIAVVLGTDPSRLGSLVVLELLGSITVTTGALGAWRARARERRTAPGSANRATPMAGAKTPDAPKGF
jgi:hypothetical protein